MTALEGVGALVLLDKYLIACAFLASLNTIDVLIRITFTWLIFINSQRWGQCNPGNSFGTCIRLAVNVIL